MSLVIAEQLAIAGRLQPTDLSLKAGSLTALIGPNGSGKTSLLHAMAGIGEARGRVRIDGAELSRLPPAARIRKVSYLPATRELVWPISTHDLVSLSGARPDEVDAAIEMLELAAFSARRADLLSTGERSRIMLARALAARPSLLLLDEPTANLDPLWQLRLLAMLQAEVYGHERAAIVAMHDLELALRYADRIIVMCAGRVAADGDPDTILRSNAIATVFRVERTPEGWVPAAIPAADR